MDIAHELIKELKRVTAELGRTPSRDEFRSLCIYPRRVWEDHFGGYTPLLHAAGVTKNKPEKMEKFKYSKQSLEGYNIHELDLEDMFKTAGNPKSVKIIAMPDTHVAHRDDAALSCFLSFVEWYNPDGFIIMGDFLDAEGISHWPSDSLKPRRFIPEILEARELLDYISKITPNCVFRAFLTGNHCDWLHQAMVAKLPELFDGLEEIGLMPDIAKLLEFEKHNIKQIPLNHFLKIGKAHFTHGLYTGESHPGAHLKKLKSNIYYGHLHDTASKIESGINGTIEAASLGCLCKLDAKFMKGRPTNWVHAFGVFEFFPDGHYTVIVPKIFSGRMSLFGRVFGHT